MLRVRDRQLVLLMAAALAGALLTGGRLPWFLFFSVAALLLLAGLWSWRLHRQLQASLDVASRRGQVGERLELQLQLVNRGPLPIPWIEVDHLGPLPDVEAAEPAALGTALPVGGQSVRLSAVARRRGQYRYGPVRVHVGDGLGLFTVERRLMTPEPITILPPVVHIGDLPLPRAQPLGEQRSQQQAFADSTQIGAARPYQPGDNPRRIHWRTSARKGALYVKTLEPTDHAALIICLDLAAAAYGNETEPADLETAVGVAAALVGWGERRGAATGLLATGARRHYLPPRPAQGLELLAALACVRATGMQPLHQVLGSAGGLLPAHCTVGVITPAMTPVLSTMLFRLSTRSPVVLFRVDRRRAGAPVGGDQTADAWQALAAQGLTVYSISTPDDLHRLAKRRMRPAAATAATSQREVTW